MLYYMLIIRDACSHCSYLKPGSFVMAFLQVFPLFVLLLFCFFNNTHLPALVLHQAEASLLDGYCQEFSMYIIAIWQVMSMYFCDVSL